MVIDKLTSVPLRWWHEHAWRAVALIVCDFKLSGWRLHATLYNRVVRVDEIFFGGVSERSAGFCRR